MAGKRSSGSGGMTKAHKEALATGRNESRVVRRYLEALSSSKPKRGRRRTPTSVEKRLAAIEEAMAAADRITTLKLSQERLDLMNELASMSSDDGMAELEEDFVAIAAQYGNRQGISYAAWREVGVQPEVLRRAGITRSA
jgi:(p)ppGpp synthase/HD superfamily hydrolase